MKQYLLAVHMVEGDPVPSEEAVQEAFAVATERWMADDAAIALSANRAKRDFLTARRASLS
jgi:hypothetical protein